MEKSMFVRITAVVAVIVSIAFSLGGAFNVGMTDFWMATPFMLLLVMLSFRSRRKYCRALSVVFVVVCIAISMTLYKNPWVFPVLREGTQVEVLKRSLFRSFSDGSGSFVEANDIYINRPSVEQQNRLDSFLRDDSASSMRISEAMSWSDFETVYKLEVGQHFPVLGVYNFGGIDSENRNYLVTTFGRIREDEIQEGNIRIVPDLPMQSEWSRYLGNLMYWPVPLLLMRSYVSESSDFNKHLPFVSH